MIRFLFACLFYTTIARWGYAEMSLMFPSAMPYINQVLAEVQIPTHVSWSRESMHEYVDSISEKLGEAEEAIQDIQALIQDKQHTVG